MTEITIVRRKQYSGLDADKANVIGELGDTYSATDTDFRYYWNSILAQWVSGHGCECVQRTVATPDFTLANFTTDGTWKIDGLDLSAIVPANAKAVVLKIEVDDDAAGSVFSVRKNATHLENTIDATVHRKDTPNKKVELVAIDSDRKLDYMGSNTTFTNINVSVLGWFI